MIFVQFLRTFTHPFPDASMIERDDYIFELTLVEYEAKYKCKTLVGLDSLRKDFSKDLFHSVFHYDVNGGSIKLTGKPSTKIVVIYAADKDGNVEEIFAGDPLAVGVVNLHDPQNVYERVHVVGFRPTGCINLEPYYSKYAC